MTTFTTRKTIRDRLATLFTSNNSWQAVYSGMPNYKIWSGQSPILTIISAGTGTRFEGLNTNPRTHRFLLTTWVLYRREADNWTYALAEDKLDELEAVLAQVIRNNAAGSTVCDKLDFNGAESQIDRITTEGGDVYLTETVPVFATLVSGAL